MMLLLLFSAIYYSLEYNYTKTENNQGLIMSLSSYTKMNVYIQSNQSIFVEEYESLMKNSQNIVHVANQYNMDDFILKNGSNYAFGSTMNDDRIIGWYHRAYVHSSSLTLNLINQAILKTLSGKDYSIQVTNKPYQSYYASRDIFEFDFLYIASAIFVILFLFLVMLSLFITSYVKERTSGVKLLQFNYGFGRITYWFTSIIFDLIAIMLILYLIYIIFVFAFFNFKFYIKLYELFLPFLYFGFQNLSLAYLGSTFFRKALYVKILIVTINLLGGKTRIDRKVPWIIFFLIFSVVGNYI